MSLFVLLLIIVLIGVAVYLINRYIPLPRAFQVLVLIVGIVAAVLIALHAFGIGIPGLDVRTPQVGR